MGKSVAADSGLLNDGCFCNGAMVMLNGTCVQPSACPVCFDEENNGRYAGETWTRADNPCVTSACQCDGNTKQMTATCPAPKVCASNEIERAVDSDSTCCPAIECVPRDTCKDATCPTYAAPDCSSAGEELQSIVHDQCCVEFVCVCNAKLCPVSKEPVCEAGEVMQKSAGSKCCQTSVCECICDRTSCPCVDQPTCDVGEKLQVTNPGECCPQYKCMCDAATCPAPND